jgi:hypothetical protein
VLIHIGARAAGQQSDGVPGPSKLAPSPSSEINDSENSQIGGRSGPFSRSGGGRNLDTAFESTLTDSRRKRLRADSSAHGSGGDAQKHTVYASSDRLQECDVLCMRTLLGTFVCWSLKLIPSGNQFACPVLRKDLSENAACKMVQKGHFSFGIPACLEAQCKDEDRKCEKRW